MLHQKDFILENLTSCFVNSSLLASCILSEVSWEGRTPKGFSLWSISNSRQLFQLLDSWAESKLGISTIRKTLFSQFDPEVQEIDQYIEWDNLERT